MKAISGHNFISNHVNVVSLVILLLRIMKTNTLLLVLVIVSVCMQCANCTSCSANESYYTAICTTPLGKLSNVTEPISLVPAGRLECTNFTDYEDITEAGRTAAGVIAAIMGSLAQVLGFVLMKYRYKKESAINFGIFQWIMSVSMWLVGMVVNFAVAGQPIFYYFSTTGGVLLSLGLLLVLPVISQFGIAVSGAIISTTILFATWITNQSGLCVQCSNSIACIISFVLLLISAILLVVVAIMKKDNNFIGLALPFHGNDRATQHQSLQRESSRDDGEFFLPKPMTDLTPATPIDTSGHHKYGGTEHGTPDDNQHENREDNICHNHSCLLGNKIPWIIRGILACASVLIGLCWGWQYVSIKFLRKCDNSLLFPCNFLAYLFGHLSGSLVFTSLMLIIFWSLLATIKLLGRCGVQVMQAAQPAVGSIEPRMIVFAALAGILWGIGLVGQLAAESMITSGLATPITTIVFALSTSFFAIPEMFKVRCTPHCHSFQPQSKVKIVLFGLALLLSVVAMALFIGYST